MKLLKEVQLMNEVAAPAFVSVRECAQRLSISAASVYRLATRGELASVRLGGRVLIRARNLEQLLVQPDDGEDETGVAS
jgi:excisionase family DNA binding protein